MSVFTDAPVADPGTREGQRQILAKKAATALRFSLSLHELDPVNLAALQSASNNGAMLKALEALEAIELRTLQQLVRDLLQASQRGHWFSDDVLQWVGVDLGALSGAERYKARHALGFIRRRIEEAQSWRKLERQRQYFAEQLGTRLPEGLRDPIGPKTPGKRQIKAALVCCHLNMFMERLGEAADVEARFMSANLLSLIRDPDRLERLLGLTRCERDKVVGEFFYYFPKLQWWESSRRR